jgi:hypothetical protein
MMNEKELFISFLKKKRIYRRFLKNCDGPLVGNPDLFIGGSFIFEDTDEGLDFWWDIDRKWRTLLKKETK